MEHQGIFLCFVGPAGGGKTTLVKEILHHYMNSVEFSVSVTTRTPRKNEKNGVDYHFYSREEFLELIKTDKLFEHEEVHGNFYGTLKDPIQRCLDRKIDLVLDIDIYGALSFKSKFPERTVIVFTIPPKTSMIRERLASRGTSESEIQKRVETARKEFELFSKNTEAIDYLIVNTDLEVSKFSAIAILRAERLKLKRVTQEDMTALCQFD